MEAVIDPRLAPSALPAIVMLVAVTTEGTTTPRKRHLTAWDDPVAAPPSSAKSNASDRIERAAAASPSDMDCVTDAADRRAEIAVG